MDIFSENQNTIINSFDKKYTEVAKFFVFKYDLKTAQEMTERYISGVATGCPADFTDFNAYLDKIFDADPLNASWAYCEFLNRRELISIADLHQETLLFLEKTSFDCRNINKNTDDFAKNMCQLINYIHRYENRCRAYLIDYSTDDTKWCWLFEGGDCVPKSMHGKNVNKASLFNYLREYLQRYCDQPVDFISTEVPKRFRLFCENQMVSVEFADECFLLAICRLIEMSPSLYSHLLNVVYLEFCKQNETPIDADYVDAFIKERWLSKFNFDFINKI